MPARLIPNATECAPVDQYLENEIRFILYPPQPIPHTNIVYYLNSYR